AQVLGDFPATGKAVEDQFHGESPDAAAAPGAADEELRHAVVDRRAARFRAAARHHGEAHVLAAAQDDQRVDRWICEPAGELVRFAVTDFSERSRAEHAGVERRKIIQIVAVDAFDPLAIAARTARIPDTDSHASPRKTKPGQTFQFLPGPCVSLSARSSNRRLLLRRLGRGRSGSGVSGRSSSGVSRSSGSGGVGGRSSSGVGGRSSSGIGSRGSSGVSSRSFRRSSFLLAAGNQREGRDRSGKGEFQFHVGVPRKYLVVSETKQTFVDTIYIAARDSIESTIHLKQLQKLSARGDRPCLRFGKSRVFAAIQTSFRAPAAAFVASQQRLSKFDSE